MPSRRVDGKQQMRGGVSATRSPLPPAQRIQRMNDCGSLAAISRWAAHPEYLHQDKQVKREAGGEGGTVAIWEKKG